MTSVKGLHHVTAIAGDPQENLDFYAGVLGMRLVKKSVNQDVPGTYHLFFADDAGHAGTDLTFFPWPDMEPARQGYGLTTEVSLAVPPGSLDFWAERLGRHGIVISTSVPRFGENLLAFRDPHGMHVALVESAPAAAREFSPWKDSAVPADLQVRGLHAVQIRARDLEATTSFLTSSLGFRHLATEGPWHRYAVEDGGSGTFVDVLAAPPEERRGAWGIGAIHHVAFRADDDAHQLQIREQVDGRAHPTEVIDRFWFKSIYFKEPGGALFEVATDGPGFDRDEEAGKLGEKLVLPPWLEPRRAEIESGLPRLTPPNSDSVGRR
jgi:glyoxalase family protein